MYQPGSVWVIGGVLGGERRPTRIRSPLLRSTRVWEALDLPEGVSAMLAMSVRLFLIAVVGLTIAAVAFLIATA